MRKFLHGKSFSLGLMVAFFFGATSAFAQVTENFGSGLPAGWSNANSSGTTSSNGYWKFSGNPGYSMFGTQSHTADGSHFAWVDGSSPYPLNVFMTTGNIDLNNYVNPHMTFWMKKVIGSTSCSSGNTVVVYVGQGGTFTPILTHTTGNTLNNDWEEFTVNLSSYTGTVQLRWEVQKASSSCSFYDDVAIDDVEVKSVVNRDVSPTDMANIAAPLCVVDTNIVVEVTNYGLDDVTSLGVSWLVNGVAMTPVTSTDTILSGNSGAIVLGSVGSLQFGDIITVITGSVNGLTDQNLSNDTLHYEYVQGLNGTYVMGPSANADFLDFDEVLARAAEVGICGATIIEIEDTLMVSQVVMDTEFPGGSLANQLIFRSQSGHADSVTVAFSATSFSSPYTMLIDQTDNVAFENITFQALGSSYARGVQMEGGTENIRFEGCKIIGGGGSSSSYRASMYVYNANAKNLQLINNEFVAGSYGLYLYDWSNQASGTVIRGNKFLNSYYRIAYVYYLDGVEFDNNYATNDGAYYTWSSYGFYIGNCGNAKVRGNHLMAQNRFPTYGLYVISPAGGFTDQAEVTNNRVVLGDTAFYTSYSYHTGMYVSNGIFTTIANNSVLLKEHSSTSSEAFYISNGAANFMYNNSFVNKGVGYAMWVNGSPFADANNNNYSTQGSILMSGGNATLADWVANTGWDSNSVSVSMPYVDEYNLITCNDSLEGKGTPVASVMYDYEGDPRDANTPDIGADEFMSASGFTVGVDQVLCDGDTLMLSQYFFDTVVWNGMDTANMIMVTNPGLNSVMVAGACGTAYDTMDVIAQVLPSLPGTTNICDASSTVLDPMIPNATSIWNDGSSDSTLFVDAPGTYSVMLTDEFGCHSVDTTVVTQSPAVDLDDEYRFCEGDQADLDAAIPGSYSWSDGSQNQFLTVTSGGTYSVTVTDGFNCVSIDTAEVVEVPLAVADFDTASISFYTVQFANNSAGADSYLWDFGDGQTSTAQDPLHVYSATWGVDTYTVVLTVTNECGSDTYEMDVVVGDQTGVEELANGSKVNLFPNPNNGEFTVELDLVQVDEVSVRVIDLSGRVIMTRELGQVSGLTSNQISMSQAATGVYVVQVQIGDQISNTRMTIK